MTEAKSSSSSSAKSKPAAKKKPAAKPNPAASIPSDAGENADAIQARFDAPYYCPGCGKPASEKAAKDGPCIGTDEAPHPAIDYVSTAELVHHEDASKLTAAPASE